MFDAYLIEHCAPTLARLKTAALFNLRFSSGEQEAQCLREWNRKLNSKGIYLMCLSKRNGASLIYVYRRSMLCKDIASLGVKAFLRAYGYTEFSEQTLLGHLRARLRQSGGFPHEIGIFLGYPLKDVQGFIQYGGKQCKCAGCWKVYGNAAEAKKLFTKYKKCREVYRRLYSTGKSVYQLTAAS